MPWFKTVNNYILRLQGARSVALGFGTDSAGKEIVIGKQTALASDTNFSDGTPSAYGKGSIVFLTLGGTSIVDGDGNWNAVTINTASPSGSPSHSTSPSHSGSPSESASVSPSHSGSPSVSPSGSVSPSHSASPST